MKINGISLETVRVTRDMVDSAPLNSASLSGRELSAAASSAALLPVLPVLPVLLVLLLLGLLPVDCDVLLLPDCDLLAVEKGR